MSFTHYTAEKYIVRLKDLEAEVEKKTLDIFDLVDRLSSSKKQLDGVNSQIKALSQLKPDIRTAISIAEEQDKTISKIETAIKSLEKVAADKEIVNKSTIVSLEDKCNTLEERIKEVDSSTKSAIEEKVEECKFLKAELDASEVLVSRLEIELAAKKKEIFFIRQSIRC